MTLQIKHPPYHAEVRRVFCVLEYALVPDGILSAYIYGEGPAG